MRGLEGCIQCAGQRDPMVSDESRREAAERVARDQGAPDLAAQGPSRDLTRQQLEEQSARAQRLEMAGRLAGQAAHDLNNLVGKLMGYPQLIKETLPEDHKAVAFCDAIARSAELIADINSNMLALSRRALLDQEPVDLKRLASQAMDLLVDAPGTLTVKLDLAPNTAAVKGSPTQLWRVLSNLIVNARHAMQDSGELRIRTENVYLDQPFSTYNMVEVGQYVKLSVCDTGHGIAPEIRTRIFDAFFTTKKGTMKGGSGLGLSVVRAIVDDHKGYIDLESEVGRGTTFSIYLPVQVEARRPDLRGSSLEARLASVIARQTRNRPSNDSGNSGKEPFPPRGSTRTGK